MVSMRAIGIYSMCVCKVPAYAYFPLWVSPDGSQSHSEQVNERHGIKEDKDEVVWCGPVVLATRCQIY